MRLKLLLLGLLFVLLCSSGYMKAQEKTTYEYKYLYNVRAN